MALDLAEVESIVDGIVPVQLDVEMTEEVAEISTDGGISGNELDLNSNANVISILPMRIFVDDPLIRPSNLNFCIKDGVLATTVETNSL